MWKKQYYRCSWKYLCFPTYYGGGELRTMMERYEQYTRGHTSLFWIQIILVENGYSNFILECDFLVIANIIKD